MATMSHAESRRMYSWWWNSHISPKNSRWLQENLTDMDSKIKSMIKLIEEDADSFARRAEMYYKKRPELMKLVEEFYRAYRALAERYDHATGALRQAHRTMAEVFPNQVPSVLTDDTPTSYASEIDLHTPEMSPPIPALFDPDDFNGIHSEEYDSVITNKKGLKQFDDIFGNRDGGESGKGRVRRGINFDEAEEEEQSSQSNENHITQDTLEKELQKLREALVKLEAEKKASLAQQKQCLDKFSQQEVEFSKAQEDSKGLTERANKAEGEVQSLKKSLSELEAGKEASLLQYQKCLERIDNLETVVSHAHQDAIELSERAHKAEIEAQALKQDLAMAKSEKDASIDQYKQSLELISTIENKLTLAEENAKKLDEQAHRAECEAETLKQALAKLTEEKEATALQHLQCLETISSLEYQNSCAQEEAQRLNRELETGVAKINGAEAQCLLLERSNQSVHSELESSMLRVLAQNEKLTKKQQELGRLGACIQEERLRYMEAETAFQTLQHLHSQTQGELQSLASELQNRTQLLSDIETHNRRLQDEVLKIKEENESLNELNLSSSMTIKDMQNEIISLRGTEGKLKEEVELRVDQRNALQQEIYCLKEEQNAMNKKYHAMLDQVEAVGFNLECFESSVKALQDENSNLKETHENEMREKACLFEKLEILETVVEKNAILEKSLSDLSPELEGTRKKLNAMEASFQSLSGEKSSLVSDKACLLTQLQEATENLEKISEKNSFLENSISDAHDELEGLKAKLKRLEDLCQLLENEKSNIIAEKATLISKVEITQKSLEDLEMNYRKIEEKCSDLEKEKGFTLCEVEGLQRKARESEQKVEKQTTEIENLCGKLLNMKMSCETLQEENVKLLDERISLKKDFLELQGKNYTLEEEYFSIIGETESLSNLSLVFKIIINEKSLELKELCIALDKLHGVNGAFEDKIRRMGGKLEEAQVEILRLKELLKNTEGELSAVKFVNGQLTYEIANGKDLLCQKEAELSEAKCKVANTADEISKWQTVVVNLKRKYNDAKILQNQANRELEAELQKRNNEIGVWEGEFTTVFSELQISSVFQAVLEEKFHELTGEWKYLKDESTIKNTGIELLKERVSTLEGKNGSLKAQLAAYVPAINSLKECICSLENHTYLHMKLQDSNNGKIKDADFGCHRHVERHEGLSEDQKERNHFLELQDLQARVKVVDKTVIETNTKLEAAMRQIEELISKGASNQENVKPLSENSELENGILTKDIMLDQISECSSYGIGRIECANTDSQGIEPWNIADLRGKVNLTVGNEKNTALTKKETEFNSEILVEKELGVDKLAISKTFLQPHQEVDKTKILERLNCDGQKLTNLQITVQDLKGKVEMSEKSEKGKSFGECNTMKGQLEKAEEAILKLFELNGQLMKSVEKFDGTTAMESEESGNLRRRTSEQARRMSERTGELQLEVQKIQFVLLKLKHESEKERKVKTETAERTRRVVLRDYLGLRTITRRKKGGFCACVRPQTSGD